MPSLAVPSCCRNPHLTDRQVDIIVLVASGLSDRQVATRLGVSVPTVRHHLQSSMQRAAVSSRTELVAVCFCSEVLTIGSWPPQATERRCLGSRVVPTTAVAG